jgi:hypothetical protein
MSLGYGLFRSGAMFGLGRQEALGFKGGHAALARGSDRLAIDIVGDVAGGKHAGH